MATHNLYLTPFDIYVILILIVINLLAYQIWKNKKVNYFFQFSVFILYLVILPFLSQLVEISHIVAINGTDDSFTLFYTFIRYPIYWTLGFIQLYTRIIVYKQLTVYHRLQRIKKKKN